MKNKVRTWKTTGKERERERKEKEKKGRMRRRMWMRSSSNAPVPYVSRSSGADVPGGLPRLCAL